jgi:YHS domain-containing protein
MFVAGFLRLLLYLALAYAVLSIVKGIAAALSRDASKPRWPAPPDALVRDDVCGLYLPRRDAIRAVVGGRERFFCSRECRAKAEAGSPTAQ